MARPVHYGVLLFPDFQLLDVMGPVDVLTVLSWDDPSLRLSMITCGSLDAVSNRPSPDATGRTRHAFGTCIVPQFTLDNAPDDIDALIVPGGKGTREHDAMTPYVDFIKARYPHLKYILSVCTGAALLARAGVLNRRRATSNKMAWDWVCSQGPETEWVRKARWVVDGNVWTTSGITAGIDGTFGLVEHLYGEDTAQEVARRMEYARVENEGDDAFA